MAKARKPAVGRPGRVELPVGAGGEAGGLVGLGGRRQSAHDAARVDHPLRRALS